MADNIWQSLLQGIKAERGTAARALVFLGGSPDDHVSIFESIAASPSTSSSHSFQTGILGYGYIDFTDDDTGECTVRLEVHSVPENDIAIESTDKTLQSALAGFLQDRDEGLESTFADEVLFVIMGSWARDPQTWPADILRNLHFIQRVVGGLSEPHRQACISSIQARVKDIEEGIMDTPMPASLMFLAMQSNDMTTLENEKQYSDTTFDYIHQYIRTVLLKYGATFATVSQQKSALETLGRLFPLLLNFPLQDGKIEADSSNRTATVIPQGWDSWAKIQVIDDSFEPQTVSEQWSNQSNNDTMDFSSYIDRFPLTASTANESATENDLQVPPMDYQSVLQEHYSNMESRKKSVSEEMPDDTQGDLTELTGPLDANIGGIQIQSTETVARKLKQRELMLKQEEANTADRSFDRSLDQEEDHNTQPFDPNEMEKLTNFFHNILDDNKEEQNSDNA
ncbi:Cytoplasmic dynein 1 light intermediate chain 1 [Yarrowia sp. C11]|nr:Cytoplasmic dynein 1 light intermediate chain 1 [Yarrowia sp. E02]KAG5372703.1 Cytoplasmic dynein 1 light intermediate chain 1 [Yarrowia sp. C11]